MPTITRATCISRSLAEAMPTSNGRVPGEMNPKNPTDPRSSVCALACGVRPLMTAATKGSPRHGRPHNRAPDRVDFERQVQPIIADHCLECHSQDKRKGGLSLATYADVLEGGRNGPRSGPATRRAAC